MLWIWLDRDCSVVCVCLSHDLLCHDFVGAINVFVVMCFFESYFFGRDLLEVVIFFGVEMFLD